VAAISEGLLDKLTLGNLSVRRDWGFAGDHCVAISQIGLQRHDEDFVIATGVQRRVSDLVATAFGAAGVRNWQKYVESEEALLRPVDPGNLFGDPTKVRTYLGWKPNRSFDDMISEMVAHDLERLRNGEPALP